MNDSRPVRDIYYEPRMQLIETLRAKGIADERVLEAIARVPREKFVHPAFTNRAYEDCALPIGSNQTISQPYTVVYMTSVLRVQPGDRILEIGTGSGYQASVLYALGAEVYSIEFQEALFHRTNRVLEELGISVHTCLGDGTQGWPEKAPFDGIIVTAGAPHPPQILPGQLKVGARLVVPVGDSESQTLYIIERKNATDFQSITLDEFKFVPLLGVDGWNNPKHDK